MYDNLDVEQQLIMYLSRLPEEVNVTKVKSILDAGVNWFSIMEYGYKNRVIYLVYDNLKKLGFIKHIPQCLNMLLEDSCFCNIERNTTKLSEINLVYSALYEKDIPFLPVKGGYMIDNVYNNRRARVTNDIDALILKKDICKIDKVLTDMGYAVGELNPETNEIVPPSHLKKILYKTKMYNLLPYVKLSDVMNRGHVIFDLSFALDFSLDTAPVEEMIANSIEEDGKKQLLPEHFFVHMCCHHYREASHIEWIRIGKDLTIMKFCDVRTFVKLKMDKEALGRAVDFAKKHGLEKAVYFTIYFLNVMYHDGYEDDLLSQLSIDDRDFLFKFSEDGKKLSNTRKKDFWHSIFDENNKDEVVDCNPVYDMINGGAK